MVKIGYEVLMKCCEIVGARDAQTRITDMIEAAVVDYL